MASKKVASAYIDLQLQTAQFKAAIGEATGEMRKFSAQTREEMNKSRESVKLMSEELGLGIPRGLQGIISKLPGVTTAMNLAFDSVVVFALIKTVVEVTEKVAEFAKKSEEASRKHREMFNDLTISMEHTNNGLRVQSDSLQRSIDKIEHKPHNGIKDAIDEAIEESDKLGEKLDANIKQIAAGLTGEQPNFAENMFLGAGSYTAGPKKLIDDLKAEMEKIELGKSLLPGADKDDQRKNALFAFKTRAEQEGAAAKPLSGTLQSTAPGYVKQEVGQYQTIAAGLSESMNTVDLMKTIAGQSAKLHGDQDNKEASDKAAQERLRSFETQFEAENNLRKMSVAQERSYWEDKLSAFTKGSGEYQTVFAKYSQSSQELSKQFIEIQKNALKRNGESFVKPPSDDETNKFIQEQPNDILHLGEAWKSFNLELAKGYEQYDKFAESLQLTKVRIAEVTGAISPHAAAMQQAAIHAASYANALQNLQEELKKVNGDSSLTNAQRATSAAGIQNQISQLGYNNQLQQLEDAVNLHKTSALGGIDAVFDEFEARSKDIGGLLKENLTEAINSINDAIIHILTTKQQPGDHPFREAGKQIFTNVAKTGLQSAEGGVMSLLGLGSNSKLGTKGNPMYVLFANALTGTASSLASGAASAASNGGLWAGLAHLIIPRASGGLMSPGDLYLTGEQGPELLQVGSTSKINNARDTASMMNGRNGDTHIHLGGIDARGATDPAAVNAAVQRGLRQAAPHFAAAANAAQKDMGRRLPSNISR